MMTGLKIIGFSLFASAMPIASILDPVESGAKTLEQSTPTFVLAAVCIVFAIAIVRLNKRNESITEKLLAALKENTEAVSAVKTVVQECHNKTIKG